MADTSVLTSLHFRRARPSALRVLSVAADSAADVGCGRVAAAHLRYGSARRHEHGRLQRAPGNEDHAHAMLLQHGAARVLGGW